VAVAAANVLAAVRAAATSVRVRVAATIRPVKVAMHAPHGYAAFGAHRLPHFRDSQFQFISSMSKYLLNDQCFLLGRPGNHL
jgi:hypothetical protein